MRRHLAHLVMTLMWVIISFHARGYAATQVMVGSTDVCASPYSTSESSPLLRIVSAASDPRSIRVELNGEELFTLTPGPNAPSGLSRETLVPLRLYNNEIAVTNVYSDNSQEKMRCYIFRSNSGVEKAHRVAILVGAWGSLSQQGTKRSFATSNVNAMKDAVLRGGSADIVELVGNEATRSNVLRVLFAKSRELGPNDQLLFYFSGPGSYDRQSHFPILVTADWDPNLEGASGLALPELVDDFAALRIPSLGIILDTSFVYAPPTAGQSLSVGDFRNASRESRIDEASASWLMDLERHRNLDFLMASRFFEPAFLDPATGIGLLTKSIREVLSDLPNSSPDGRCRGIQDFGKLLASTDSLEPPRQVPLFFSTTDKNPAFCFTRAGVQEVSLKVLPAGSGFVRISATVPIQSGARQYSLINNDVPLYTDKELSLTAAGSYLIDEIVAQTSGENEIRLDVSDGHHLLFSGEINDEGDRPGAVERLDLVSGPVLVLTQPPLIYGDHDRDPVNVGDERELIIDGLIHLYATTSATAVVRNNGVVVFRRAYDQQSAFDNIRLWTRVPLLAGRTNNIELDIESGNVHTLKQFAIRRASRQSLAAVLIGVDSYQDTAIKPSTYVREDVQLMKSMLYNYADIDPQDIIELSGRSADSKSILSVFSAAELLTRLQLQGSRLGATDLSDATILYYFAGRGATVETSPGTSSRCVLPFDVTLRDLNKSCIPTTAIDSKLSDASWKNSILIFDTSYDGRATLFTTGKEAFASRTLVDHFSTDSDWRLKSGVADDPQSNRIFVVAGDANQAALESSTLRDGLLTRGLQLGFNRAGAIGLGPHSRFTIQDVYGLTRDFVDNYSDHAQTPVLKGGLSRPVFFERVDTSDLRPQWSYLLTKAHRDSIEMRKIDSNELAAARRVLFRAQALKPDDPSVKLGLGVASLYEASIVCHAAVDCNEYLNARELLSDAVAMSVKDSGSAMTLYESRLASAVLFIQGGEFGLAISMAQQAEELSEELKLSYLRARFTLAEAYLARADYTKAGAILDNLLKGLADNQHAVGLADGLTAEEQAKVVIWRAMLLLRDGQSSEGKALLQNYVQRTASIPQLVGGFFTKPLWKVIGRSNDERIESVRSLSYSYWGGVIINLLLGKDLSESSLRELLLKNSGSDLNLDEAAFQCQYNFYIGLKRWLLSSKRDLEAGGRAFQLAVAGGQTQYIEYWLSKAASFSMSGNDAADKAKDQPESHITENADSDSVSRVLEDSRSDTASKIVALQKLTSGWKENGYLGSHSLGDPLFATVLDLTRHSDPAIASLANAFVSQSGLYQALSHDLVSADPLTRSEAEKLLFRVPTPAAVKLVSKLSSEVSSQLKAKLESKENDLRVVPTASPQGDRYYVKAEWDPLESHTVGCLTELFNRELISSRTLNQERDYMRNRRQRIVYWYDKGWSLHMADEIRSCGAQASFVAFPGMIAGQTTTDK